MGTRKYAMNYYGFGVLCTILFNSDLKTDQCYLDISGNAMVLIEFIEKKVISSNIGGADLLSYNSKLANLKVTIIPCTHTRKRIAYVGIIPYCCLYCILFICEHR